MPRRRDYEPHRALKTSRDAKPEAMGGRTVAVGQTDTTAPPAPAREMTEGERYVKKMRMWGREVDALLRIEALIKDTQLTRLDLFAAAAVVGLRMHAGGESLDNRTLAKWAWQDAMAIEAERDFLMSDDKTGESGRS